MGRDRFSSGERVLLKRMWNGEFVIEVNLLELVFQSTTLDQLCCYDFCSTTAFTTAAR